MSLVGNSGKCWVEFVVEGGGEGAREREFGRGEEAE